MSREKVGDKAGWRVLKRWKSGIEEGKKGL